MARDPTNRPRTAKKAGGMAHGGINSMSKQNPSRRSYGTGSLYVRRGKWYGHWRVDGRQVKLALGPKREPGSREGLTRKMAEAELRRAMAATRPVPSSRRRDLRGRCRRVPALRGRGPADRPEDALATIAA